MKLLEDSSDTKVHGFVDGFQTPMRGLRFMMRHQGLWRYGIVAVLLNLVITGLTLLLALLAYLRNALAIHDWFERGDYPWYWETAAFLAMFIIIIGVALATWKLLEGILCGFFYGKLAVQVELRTGTAPSVIHGIPFHYQIVDTLLDVAKLVLINVSCLVFACVPIVGAIGGLALGLYLGFWILGVNFMSIPRVLRGDSAVECKQYCSRYRYRTLGMGSAVLLCSLVPIVGAVLLTTAVTGSVLLHQRLVELEAGGKDGSA